MFQLTITWTTGEILVTKSYEDATRRPSTRKARNNMTLGQLLAWCARNGKAVSAGYKCETWQFVTP